MTQQITMKLCHTDGIEAKMISKILDILGIIIGGLIGVLFIWMLMWTMWILWG